MKTALLFFLISSAAIAQGDFDPEWMVNERYNTAAQVNDMLYDEQGYLYCAQRMGPELKKEETRLFQSKIVKYGKKGKVLWESTLNAERFTGFSKMAMGMDGNLSVLSFCQGSAVLKTRSSKKQVYEQSDQGSLEESGFILANYSSKGKLKWVKKGTQITDVKGLMSGRIMSIDKNSHNEIFISIQFHGSLKWEGKTIYFDVEEDQNKRKSAIIKLDPKGDFVEIVRKWVDLDEKMNETIESQMMTRATVYLKIDNQDNLVLYGKYAGALKLSEEVSMICYDRNIYEPNSSASFVAKYDSRNNLLWNSKIGGRYEQEINDLDFDAQNNVYVVGHYRFECLFSNGVEGISQSGFRREFKYKMFYAKYDAEGQLEFSKFQNSLEKRTCLGYALCCDPSGIVHITGVYTGSLNFESQDFELKSFGNSTWFYSLWKDDELLHLQNLYGVNASSLESVGRSIASKGSDVSIGGFYYDGTVKCRINSDSIIPLLPSNNEGRSFVLLAGTSPTAEYYFRTHTKVIEKGDALIKNEIEHEEIISSPRFVDVQEGQNDFVEVYPNPFSSVLNVKLSKLKGWAKISLLDANGKIIYTHQVSELKEEQEVVINTSSLVRSTYFVVVNSENSQRSFQVIKSY